MIANLYKTACYYPLKKGKHYIYDDDKNDKPIFLKKKEDWNLKISNKSTENVDFFQNDNCIMTDNAMKKCDWICIYANNFYFIEAKDVKIKQRSKACKNAKEKFNDTIPYFLKYYPDLKEKTIFVILNFKSVSKLTRAVDKAKKMYYNTQFNANYKETNKLKFK